MIKVRLLKKRRTANTAISSSRQGIRYAGGGSASDYASEAGHSLTADEANHAANADNANESIHSATADSATEANHSQTADKATNADSAEKAKEADHAANSADLDSDSSVWTTIKGWIDTLKNNCLKWFLRKDIEDTAAKHITFDGGLSADDIHSKRYNDSLDLPSGMGYHIWVNGATSNAVFDNLSVRGKWTASVLEVMNLQYSAGNITIDGAGGEIFAVVPFDKNGNSLIPTDNLITTATAGNLLSDEGKVLKEDKKLPTYTDSDVFFYRCYFKATDGEKNILNMWHVGDQARCQTFNLSDGTHLYAQNKTYFRVVINKSDVTVLVDGVPCFYIDLSNVKNGTLTGDDGKAYNYMGLMHSKADDGTVTWIHNDPPEKGDQVAHVGNIYDEKRQGAVQLVAVGDEKGMFLYDGINETLENLDIFIRIKLTPRNSLVNTTFITYTNGYHTNNPYIYCGDFIKGRTTAHPNEVWQYTGSSWICNITTTTEPSVDNPAWSFFAQKGEKGDKGDKGDSVKKTGEKIEYTISASGTTAPSDGWQLTIPSATKQKPYLWTRSTITLSSGDPIVSYSVSRQGTDGTNGSNGKPLKVTSVTKYHKGDKPTSDSGYELDSFPSVGQGDVVWNITITTYIDPDTNKTIATTTAYGCSRIGTDGTKGAGVHIAYATSADGKTGFSTVWFANATYLGVCVSQDTDDPTDYTQYQWSKIKGEKGDKGDSVVKTGESIDYQISNSGTTVPTGTWSKTIPTATADKPYLWTRSTIKFNVGDDVVSYSVSRQGINGQNGKNGKPLKVTSTTKYYKGASKPTSDSGYNLTDFPSVSQGDIVWSLTTTTYTDPDSNKVVDTTKAYGCSRIGYDGDNGAGIHIAYSTTYPLTSASQFSKTYKEGIQYIGTYSSTETNDGEWNDKRWVWQKIKGEQGPQGRPGNDGTSVTITSTSVSYQISNSATTIPTGTWSKDIVKATDEKPYLWTKTVVNYSDGKFTTSYSVSYKGKDGSTPSVSISTDGYWVINGTKTNDKAIGDDGHNPYVGDDGYWYTWNEKQGKFVSTGIKAKGDKGDSIKVKSTETSYQLSNNGTTPPTGKWTTGNVPETTDSLPYLWTRVIITFTDGKSATSYSVARRGVSISITSTSTVYAITTDNTQPTKWPYTSIPRVKKGMYLWSKTTVNYSDGSHTDTIAVSRIGTDGDKGASLHVAYSTAYPVTKDSFTKVYKEGVKYVGIYTDVDTTNLMSASTGIMITDDGQLLTFPDSSDGEWNDPRWVWQRIKGDDGNDAEAYYVNPTALIVTERLNISDNDTLDQRGNRYKDKDFVYDIPSKFAIHHSKGDKDSIVMASSWQCTEGKTLIQSPNWVTNLQNSFISGVGYDLNSILTKAGLKADSDITKITLVAGVTDSVSLNVTIYINRLGTVQSVTYGDTTETVRTKVVTDLSDDIQDAQDKADDAYKTAQAAQETATDAQGKAQTAITTTTTFKSDLKDASDEFSRKLTETTDIIRDVAVGEGSSADIDLSSSSYDVNTFYLVIIFQKENVDSNGNFSHELNDGPDLFYFGVKKALMKDGADEPKTAYGTWQPENGKGGFETYLQWQEHFSDWGARNEERIVDNYSKLYIKDDSLAVGGIGQYHANGPVYVYLRGGTRYHVYCDHMDMVIRLARQADINNFSSSSSYTKPALKVALSGIDKSTFEPTPERKVISSEINQTAREISMSVNEQTEKGLKQTGIDIQSGKIEAKTGKFDFVGQDEKPYIKVEQDDSGYPHLIFYNPTKKDSSGNPMPAFDLGYSGLRQIIGTGQIQQWGHVPYQKTVAAGATTNARDFYREMIALGFRDSYIYIAGYYYNSQYGKVWLPAEAEKYNGLYYDTMSKDRDDLPTGSFLSDGWHIYQNGYKSGRMNDGTANAPHYGYWYEYTYRMFYTKSGVRLSTEHIVSVRYTDSRYTAEGYDYRIYFDGNTSSGVYGDNEINFPSVPTK